MKKEEMFIQPESLAAAQKLLGTLTEDSVIVAGGTDLLISMRNTPWEEKMYFSLWRIPELRNIEYSEDQIKIGSMVTHTQAAEDKKIFEHFRALTMACEKIGSCQIRNKGTLGGNLMNGSPAGDILPCLCLFQAELEFMSPEGFRKESVFEFLKKKKEQRIKKQEILSAIYLPLPSADKRDSCFLKLGEREEVTIAQISLGIIWTWEGKEKRKIKMYMGAVDVQTVFCPCASLLEGEKIQEESVDRVSEILREQIRQLRKKRTRQPKLKLTEAERHYKERAVKGLVYEIAEEMNQRRR